MSGNIKLDGVLSDTYAALREFNRRVTARVDGSTSATDRKYYSILRELVLDDMTFIETIRAASDAGYIDSITDKLTVQPIHVESDFMKKYVPVMMQYDVMLPYNKALCHAYASIRTMHTDWTHKRAFCAIADTCPPNVDISAVYSCGMESGDAVLVLGDDSSKEHVKVRSFIELHILMTLFLRGMPVLGSFVDLKTVGMLIEASDHTRSSIVPQHRNTLAQYEKMFHAALPNMQATRIAELMFAIEVAGNDTAIVARKLYSVQTKTAQRIADLEDVVETNRIEASRQSSDNTIIAAIIVLIIVFAVSSFIH